MRALLNVILKMDIHVIIYKCLNIYIVYRVIKLMSNLYSSFRDIFIGDS